MDRVVALIKQNHERAAYLDLICQSTTCNNDVWDTNTCYSSINIFLHSSDQQKIVWPYENLFDIGYAGIEVFLNEKTTNSFYHKTAFVNFMNQLT